MSVGMKSKIQHRQDQYQQAFLERQAVDLTWDNQYLDLKAGPLTPDELYLKGRYG